MPLAITLPHHPGTLRSSGPYPRALKVLSRKQTAVQRQLRRAGLAGYEPLTQATLLALAQRAPAGSAVYDVGAHIGLYAALIDAVYGGSPKGPRVIAFEPTPETAEICSGIRRHNGLGFELIQSAVAAEPGSAELYMSLKGESSNSLNAAHRSHNESVTVPVTTIDAVTEERQAHPHLIKIDVETLEGQVLEGGLETIRRHRPWIVLEILPSSDHAALERALETVSGLDYGLHLIQPETPWHGRGPHNYRPYVGSQCRDWLLAPEPLTYDFHHAVRSWLAAILACDERTNVEYPAGSDLPHGWNAPYGRTPTSRRGPLTSLLRAPRRAQLAGRLLAAARRR